MSPARLLVAAAAGMPAAVAVGLFGPALLERIAGAYADFLAEHNGLGVDAFVVLLPLAGGALVLLAGSQLRRLVRSVRPARGEVSR